MNRPPVVIVDADAIIAQINQNDKHHQAAMAISGSLVDLGAQVIYPATAVAEAVTFIQRPLNNPSAAYGTAQLMTDPSVQVAEVNQQTLNSAVKYLSPKASKKNTLFDCIVVAIARESHADMIFSFDHFYKKQGFKLTSEVNFKSF